jgi:hypothetical protein
MASEIGTRRDGWLLSKGSVIMLLARLDMFSTWLDTPLQDFW